MARVVHLGCPTYHRASATMESGIDFLRSQIGNAVMQHDLFLRSVVDHESVAQDQRFRDLCSRHIPRMREHQRMLEDFQRQIAGDTDAEATTLENIGGALKKAAGTAFGIAKDLADAPRQ